MQIDMTMARPTLRCGSVISAPLLVIVVKPLKARIDSAMDATNPAIPKSSPVPVALKEMPEAHRAAAPKRPIPATLMTAITTENSPTDLLPATLTR